jgi:hypothetical protein
MGDRAVSGDPADETMEGGICSRQGRSLASQSAAQPKQTVAMRLS